MDYKPIVDQIVVLFLLAAVSTFFSSAAAKVNEDVFVERIFDQAPHSAFTDLLEVDGTLYCTFREGDGHVYGADGRIRILEQQTDGSWRSVALLQEDGVDLRDPKISLMPNGRIMVNIGGSFYDGSTLKKCESRVSFSDQKRNDFSDPVPIQIDEQIRSNFDWLWRVTWNGDTGYGVVYQTHTSNGNSAVHLVSTSDGIHYQLIKALDLDGNPNETTLRFTDDEKMVALIRREGEQATAVIGSAHPPYTEWTFAPLPVRLGGPNLIELPDGTWLASGRDYRSDGQRTVVARVGLDGSWRILNTLPSGGDTSYPGMVLSGDDLLLSYYSSHEEKTAIYLAKMGIPQLNFVVIFCDDLGYGDLACYGHPTIRTPHLDRMAEEGQRWTNFYCAAPVCTPSRAALMTGRLPIRSGMCSGTRRVLFPNSGGGIPENETTLAEALHAQGYATGHFGKWHLGHLPQHLPTRHGFDTYFGIPFSNDMMWAGKKIKHRDAFANPKIEYWNVPLMRDEVTIEQPADQRTITRRYTEEAAQFIREHGNNKPFFVYLAHSMPHVPLFRSDEFAGRSPRGMYGDVIEEIDFSVGTILNTLREEGLAENTLVVFTSDNGPWLPYDTHGGSAGLLRDGKGSTFEGGMRVPGIFWGPGIVAPGIERQMGSTLDLMPTFMAMSGHEMPTTDGVDLSQVLTGTQPEDSPPPRTVMFFYRGEELFAVRAGQYKAHFKTRSGYGEKEAKDHNPPLLYNLDVDPGESVNIAHENPEVLAAIAELATQHRKTIEPVENQLNMRIPQPPSTGTQ